VRDVIFNCALHSGINVVRQAIKGFAQKKVTLPPGKHKIVILDEADKCEFPVMFSRTPTTRVLRSLTPGAQQTMRRTMEKFSSTTRFALACNQSTKIIEPIQSR
jgi:replication factor C subunit 2/4